MRASAEGCSGTVEHSQGGQTVGDLALEGERARGGVKSDQLLDLVRIHLAALQGPA